MSWAASSVEIYSAMEGENVLPAPKTEFEAPLLLEDPEGMDLRRFAVGLGAGVVRPTGQQPADLKTKGPSFEIKSRYALNNEVAMQFSYTRAGHSYSAGATNPVDVTTQYLTIESVFKPWQPVWAPLFLTGFGGAIHAQQVIGVEKFPTEHYAFMSLGLGWEIPVTQRLILNAEWKYRLLNPTELTRSVNGTAVGVSNAPGSPLESGAGSSHTVMVSVLSSF